MTFHFNLFQRIVVASLSFPFIACSPSINETAEGIGREGFRVSRFSQEEANELWPKTFQQSCNICMRLHSDQSTDCILLISHSEHTNQVTVGKGFMKVNGAWVELDQILEETRFPLAWLDFAGSNENNTQSYYVHVFRQGKKLANPNTFLIEINDDTARKIKLTAKIKDEDCLQN